MKHVILSVEKKVEAVYNQPCAGKKTHKASVTAKEKMSIKKGYCQEWDSNPCPCAGKKNT